MHSCLSFCSGLTVQQRRNADLTQIHLLSGHTVVAIVASAAPTHSAAIVLTKNGNRAEVDEFAQLPKCNGLYVASAKNQKACVLVTSKLML